MGADFENDVHTGAWPARHVNLGRRCSSGALSRTLVVVTDSLSVAHT